MFMMYRMLCWSRVSPLKECDRRCSWPEKVDHVFEVIMMRMGVGDLYWQFGLGAIAVVL